jgi:mobilome CxxCx(11)CxxC protein
MSEPEKVNQVRQQCWDEALHCFGTAWIFERRARQLRSKLRLLAFLGLAVPVFVGGSVGALGTNHPSLPYLLGGAAVLGGIQAIASVWSLTSKWEDGFAYALESIASNHRLSKSYQDIAKNPPDAAEFQLTFKLLNAESQQRSDQDYKQTVSEAEKRAGLRAALFRFKRQCGACGQVPKSLQPTDCSACGNFPRRLVA